MSNRRILPVFIFCAAVTSTLSMFAFTQFHELPYGFQTDSFVGDTVQRLLTATRLILNIIYGERIEEENVVRHKIRLQN